MPTPGITPDEWSSIGDWLLLADRVGADRLFFVNNDPVLVFSSLPEGASSADIFELYRRTWSLSRPRCLFLAVGDELRVYALNEPPTPNRHGTPVIEPLEVLERTADVGERLARFHRERIESGSAFYEIDQESRGRADQRLLHDVAAATAALVDTGLTHRTAHHLLERAILVRYLEDRGVLAPSYFDETASAKSSWSSLLSDQSVVTAFGPRSSFLRCLEDRELTRALFAQLARDFNGDLFVADEGDDDVTSEHLALLRSLLQGTYSAPQEPLFLWAYDFSVVPTSLVSTMYELFYHQELEDQESSTYYTPPQLVEFVLGDVLSDEVLSRQPRVCDPACGSGVFLVEAYRRIVRYEMARSGGRLSSDRLRELLLDRVVGTDIDEAAVRLAAFSLYVAFLNYQSPTDIRQAGPLPRLIWRPEHSADRSPLAVADAFTAVDDSESSVMHPLKLRPIDVVVGNPPWTEPAQGTSSLGETWAKAHGLAVGDRNPSQLFLWLAVEMLAEGGVAALLVGAKAFLNERGTAKQFRRDWLARVQLQHVLNFIEVRGEYFESARAPFALVRFRRSRQASPDHVVIYETARKTRAPRGTLAYARFDRRLVPQASLQEHDFLWKTYMLGGRRDEALIRRLMAEGSLRDLVSAEAPPRYGYQPATPRDRTRRPPSAHIRDLPSLRRFESWGPLERQEFEPVPSLVKREPHPAVFSGRRLIASFGVIGGERVPARVEELAFAFRHNVYAIPLAHRPEWHAQVALGVLLSGLGRYWLAMVSGGWGTWREQIRAEGLLGLPVRLTTRDDSAVAAIVDAVEALPALEDSGAARLWDAAERHGDLSATLEQLDRAVEELFDLSTAERDLVRDFWFARTDRALNSIPDPLPREGTARDLALLPTSPVASYLDAFLDVWNGQLGEGGELSWHVFRDHRAEVIGVLFQTRLAGEPFSPGTVSELDQWAEVLSRLGTTLSRPGPGTLQSHGLVRAVTDTAIIVVKRDEERLWTRSAAREDAEATTLQAMKLQMA